MVENLWPSILAGLGLALMIGLSGSGSAIGLVISGSSVIGAIKKRPEAFGSALVAAVMPSTQGIYGFVGFFIYMSKVTPNITLFNASLVFGAGIMLGLAALISAIQQGKVCAASVNAIGSGHNTLGPGLIMGAMPEFYAILALVASIILSGQIK